MYQSWPGKKPWTQSIRSVLGTVLHGPVVVALGYWVVAIPELAVLRSCCWANWRARFAAASSKARGGAAASTQRQPTSSHGKDFSLVLPLMHTPPCVVSS